MRKDRLLKLADFLETVPRDRFYMTDFHLEGSSYKPCGFAGCAMGWAAVSKKFRGLDWDRGANTITYKGHRGGFLSAEILFEIGPSDSRYLFNDQCPAARLETPKEVAKRIRKFVKDAGAAK